MTDQLSAAFAEASQVPASEQDALAAITRKEIVADRRWKELFADPASHQLMERLADESLAEHAAGRTRKLDVNSL